MIAKKKVKKAGKKTLKKAVKKTVKKTKKNIVKKPASKTTKKKVVSKKVKSKVTKKKVHREPINMNVEKTPSTTSMIPERTETDPGSAPPVKPDAKKGCPECGSSNIKFDHGRGESVCEACGAVIGESMIDLTQEWRAFDEDQRSRRVRTGAALTPTKHDEGITTEIGKGRGELFKVSSKKRAQYYRLTKWHKRLIKSKDRNLSFAFSELQRLISYLHLSRAVHERVAKLYQHAVEKGLVRGRSTESIIAALLYTTCREEGAPRTLDEISKASGINRRDIGKTYRYISRKLSIRILPAKAQDYVPRFGSLLNLSEKVQVRAVDVLDEAAKSDVTSGKGPIGVAAAALYIAAVLEGEKKTQREVADAIGVTEVTIRNRYKEMVETLGIKDEVEERVREEEET